MRIENRSHSSRAWPGLFIVVVGVVLLMRQLGFMFPYWFFQWPMILIAVGFFVGIRHGFRGLGWAMLMFIGALFLAGNVLTDYNLKPYIGPVIVITLGLILVFRPKGRFRRMQDEEPAEPALPQADDSRTRGFVDSNDILDTVCIFSGTKKNIVSKNFKGGDLVNIMGGSEISLVNADFNGKIMIDVTCIFGGAKLYVPSSWNLQNDIVGVFGGIDDKRTFSTATDLNKTLVLSGVCIFGGVEIRSL